MHSATWKRHGIFLIVFGAAIFLFSLGIYGTLDAIMTALLFSLPFVVFGLRFITRKRPCPRCHTSH